MRPVAVGQHEFLTEVRVVICGPRRRRVRLRRLGRHPRGAPAARIRAGPGAGRMVAGALARENRVAETVGNGREIDLAIAIERAAPGRTEDAGQPILTRTRRRVAAGAVEALLPAVAGGVV